jgi:hypothetical protein
MIERLAQVTPVGIDRPSPCRDHYWSLVLSGGMLGYRTALGPAFAQPHYRETWLPVLFKFAVAALCITFKGGRQ